MSISFETALGIHESALRVRGQRAGILANNLANIDTPNYKARDLDFKAILNQTTSESNFNMQATNERHISMGLAFGDDSDFISLSDH